MGLTASLLREDEYVFDMIRLLGPVAVMSKGSRYLRSLFLGGTRLVQLEFITCVGSCHSAIRVSRD